MKIRITEKRSEGFCKEVINVAAQYRKLLRKPNLKLKDYFKTMRRDIILGCILLILLIIDGFFWGVSTINYILMTALLILILFSAILLSQYKKRLKTMMADLSEAELTLDEDGIELKKPSMTLRWSWENIVFVRVFKESVCFIPKEETRLVLSVSKTYYEEMKPYIKKSIIE